MTVALNRKGKPYSRKLPKQGWSKVSRKSRAKGHNFYKSVSQRLTQWITGETHPELFWGTSGSGARATAMLKRGKNVGQHGDIMATDQASQWFTDYFFIECKSYSKLDFSLILEGKGNVLDWWNKCCTQAASVSKQPMLIMKQNASKTYVMCQDQLPVAVFRIAEIKIASVDINGSIFLFDELLKKVSPRRMRLYVNKQKRSEGNAQSS